MRIVAGEFRSRILVAPKGDQTRPTTDRARESLFNVLTNVMDFEGAKVLDLFAGSGALGFEAISRGAASVTFVDNSRNAAIAVRENIRVLGLDARAKFEQQDTYRFVTQHRTPFDVIFADAPYDDHRATDELPALLLNSGLVALSTIVVFEHRAGSHIVRPTSTEMLRELKAGEACFTVIRKLTD